MQTLNYQTENDTDNAPPITHFLVVAHAMRLW